MEISSHKREERISNFLQHFSHITVFHSFPPERYHLLGYKNRYPVNDALNIGSIQEIS